MSYCETRIQADLYGDLEQLAAQSQKNGNDLSILTDHILGPTEAGLSRRTAQEIEGRPRYDRPLRHCGPLAVSVRGQTGGARNVPGLG